MTPNAQTLLEFANLQAMHPTKINSFDCLLVGVCYCPADFIGDYF